MPTAVVYVGSEEEERRDSWLSASALQHSVSALQAELIHTKHRQAVHTSIVNRSHDCSLQITADIAMIT